MLETDIPVLIYGSTTILFVEPGKLCKLLSLISYKGRIGNLFRRMFMWIKPDHRGGISMQSDWSINGFQ